MLNRVLLFLLTSVATCGLSTTAIARASEVSTTPGKLHSRMIISQTDGGGSQQPSAAIRSLQNRLIELGYYSGPVNGLFNNETREALTEFQQDSGLVGTGILDPLTQQRLADPDGTQSPPASETPETPSDEQSAAPNPLDLPPVSENGEVALPDDAAAGESGATAQPGTATEGNNEATSPVEGETAPPAETAATNNRSFVLPILLGALVLILGGIGGGVAIWFSKRQKSEETPPAPQSPPSSGTEYRRSGQQTHHSPKPPPAPRMTNHAQNGQPAGTQDAALDIQHRSQAINNLAEPRLAKVNIIDELIQDLQRPDPELRRKAIWELGQRGNSAAMQPLVNLLTEVDSHEQSLILAALAEITSQTLKPMNRAVMIALQSENAEVRKNAIRDLTRIFDSLSQSGRMLGHVAIDDDPDVRQTADWALDQLNKMRSGASETAARLRASEATQERLSSEVTQEKLSEDGNSTK